MNKQTFSVIAIAVFGSAMGLSILGPILPIFSRDIGATGIWIGIIVSAYSVSRALVMPFTGRLSDNKGRKLMLSLGLLLTGLISLAYIVAFNLNHLGLLVAVRVFHGIAAAMVIPIAQAWIGELAPAGEEGRWMSYFSVAFTGGLGAGPVVGGFLAVEYGTATPFIAMSGLNILSFILVSSLIQDGKTQQTVVKARPSFRLLLRQDMFKGLFIFRTAFEFVMGVIMAFLPIFAGTQLGLDPFQISILFTANLIVVTVLMPFSGRIADRFNRRLLVVIGAVITFGILALYPEARSFGQLLGLVVFRGLGGTLSLPAASALVVGEGRRHGMGQAMGIIAMATAIGLGAGPIAGGIVADWIGIKWVFYLASCVGAVGTVLFVWLSKQREQNSPIE